MRSRSSIFMLVGLTLLAASCGGKIAPYDELDLTGAAHDSEGDDDEADAARDEDDGSDGEAGTLRRDGGSTEVGTSSNDDVAAAAAAACQRPRGAVAVHTCSSSCQTRATSYRLFGSPEDLLGYLQTTWLACADDVAGYPANGITFSDGCRFMWLVDGRTTVSGTFDIARFDYGSRTGTIALNPTSGPTEAFLLQMSECPNQLRISRGGATTYLMAAQ